MNNYESIDLEIYSCIKSLFKIVNENEGFLKIENKMLLINSFENLIGTECLWNIFLKCKND